MTLQCKQRERERARERDVYMYMYIYTYVYIYIYIYTTYTQIYHPLPASAGPTYELWMLFSDPEAARTERHRCGPGGSESPAANQPVGRRQKTAGAAYDIPVLSNYTISLK